MYKIIVKPLFDFFASLLELLLLNPILLVRTFLLAFFNFCKLFFFNIRSGKNAKTFRIKKLKTIYYIKDINGNLLSDAEQLTKIFTFNCKTSLNQIPQFLNVLKGDMRLIGRRPLLVQYLHLYSDLQNRRQEVKPEISGWAQVNGRNGISWKQKFEYDVWYVEHYNFLIDVKILFWTIKKMFFSESISQGGQVAMQAFKGNNHEN